MVDKQIFWQPHPGPQTEVLKCIEFEILFGGSRGGGKTDAGLAWLIRWIHLAYYRALVIRRNSDDLRDWVDRAQLFYGTCGGKVVGNPPEVRFPSGAKIRTGHLKDDNAYTKYQGHEYQKMLIEELTQIDAELNYLKLIASCRSTNPDLKPQVFATTNPGGQGHQWVKERFNIVGTPTEPIKTLDEGTGRKRIFIPARVDDNPTLMDNDPHYVAFLDSLPENLMKAWRLGSWDLWEGQFFNEWSEDVHVVNPFPIPPTFMKYRSTDFGRTAPFATVCGAVDYDGNVYIYREYYQAGVDADVNAGNLAIACSEDPINPETGNKYELDIVDRQVFQQQGQDMTIAEILEANGMPNLVPAGGKQAGGRVARWTIFHEYLRHNTVAGETIEPPRLFVFSNCTNVRRTIPQMIHNQPPKDPEDLDTTLDDHLVDAISYLLTTLHELKSKQPLTPLQKKMKALRAGKDIHANPNILYGANNIKKL